MFRFSAKAIEKLKYYVYLYVDPRTDEVFYVGQGCGNRAFSHLRAKGESSKVDVIKELAKLGFEPRIEILKCGLTEDQALLVEATAIDLLDVKKLKNKVRGHGARYGTRDTAEEIAAQLDARDVEIEHAAVLINIARQFRYGMKPEELYDVTRCAWAIAHNRKKADKAEYAFSVYHGVVREVYSIATWVRAGTTFRVDDPSAGREKSRDRWEFVGRVADEKIRKKYLGRSVQQHFPKGAANPIRYVNC
jgi:hypothetical protein